MTKEEVIKNVMGGGGHVVILGAGASIASTFKTPEKNNKILPSMDNLIEVVGLVDILKKLPKRLIAKNFEQLYNNLFSDNPLSSEIKEIENRIYLYFKDMQLPDEPTIYDYLILSLRPKDLIATFNWDPFLYQAFIRNRHVGDMPYISFLHGNVAIGYSEKDKRCGPAGWNSRKTGSYFEPTKLLYPVNTKNYTNSEFISIEWDRLKGWLNSKKTNRISIFGYGAPNSDIEAIKLLKEAWATPKKRDVEEFEIIDVRPEEQLRDQWKEFIYETHYSIHKNFFESVIASQPRRTSESFFHHYFPLTEDEAWSESNPVPKDFKTLQELWNWYKPLIEAEEEWKKKQD